MTPAKILFKLATRGRANDFFEAIDSIYHNVWDLKNFHILVTAGEDDYTMNNEEVKGKLRIYDHLTIIFGENSGKVQATNRDMDLKDQVWSDWDILINTADDQRFIQPGFDDFIRVTMANIFPENDGFLHLYEPDAGAALPVLYCAGRKFYEVFNFIAHPQYKSLFWDNYYFECAKLMKKYHFVGTHIFNHLCPAYTHHNKPRDAMFDRDQALWGYDENVFYKHKGRGYDLSIDDNGKFKFNLILDPTPGND